MGSLRNAEIPAIGNVLRAAGHEVFDDWHGAGPYADDEWQRYETERGRTFAEALAGHACANIVGFDQGYLDEADLGVLVMPAGKSAHMELGYLIGKRTPCFVLFPEPPERYDAMYRLGAQVVFSVDELIERLK